MTPAPDDGTPWAAIGTTLLECGPLVALLAVVAVLLFPSTRRAPTGVGPGRFLLAAAAAAVTVAAIAWAVGRP